MSDVLVSGRGGMGMVYKARQKNLDRLVALEILLPKIARDPAFAERFAREARAMALLSHPHIVAVFDFGKSAAGASPGDEQGAELVEHSEPLQYAHDKCVDQRVAIRAFGLRSGPYSGVTSSYATNLDSAQSLADEAAAPMG